MARIIFHVDVNSAFLSWSAVEALAKDPDALDLRTVPSAVGGDVDKRHGVITARSIPAKKYGVKTGEPVVTALKKCPQLILVKADFKAYRRHSDAFESILREYSDLVEKASIDEAYVDVTDVILERMRRLKKSDGIEGGLSAVEPERGEGGGSKKTTEIRCEWGRDGGAAAEAAESGVFKETEVRRQASGLADEMGRDGGAAAEAAESGIFKEAEVRRQASGLADEIRSEVKSRLGFTVNVGISENKLLAKTASDFTKPDRTHELWPDEVQKKLWPLPIGDLFGCGGKTAEKLKRVGVFKVGDAAKAGATVLKALLGEKSGEYIAEAALGHGSDIVDPSEREAKSCSNETTTPYDITAENYAEEMPRYVKELSDKVAERLKKDGLCGGAVSVSVKTNGFERHSRQIRLAAPTDSAKVIKKNAEKLLLELSFGQTRQPPFMSDPLAMRQRADEEGAGAKSVSSAFENEGVPAQASQVQAAAMAEGRGSGGRPRDASAAADGLLLSPGSGYRLIGVGALYLEEKRPERQLDLGDLMRAKEAEEEEARKREKKEKLDAMVEGAEKKFGKAAIVKGTEFTNGG